MIGKISDARADIDALSALAAARGRPLQCDPLQPVPERAQTDQPPSVRRYNHYFRRSRILAAIRRVLAESGLEGITVRHVAKASGHAVQTVYSLVGARDEAIVEAISEYTRFVGRMSGLRAEDPCAIELLVGGWLDSIESAPDFCRNVSLIALTDFRSIYYRFRDRQVASLSRLLARQQRCGVLRAGVDVGDLSEHLICLAGALCLQWSDRRLPLEQLRRRLSSGCAALIAGALR